MRNMREPRQEVYDTVSRDADISAGMQQHASGLASSRNYTELWSRFSWLRHGDYFKGAHILMVGFAQCDQLDLEQSLSALGVPIVTSVSCLRPLDEVTRLTSSFTYMLVNFDAFDNPEAGIDALIAFRAHAPESVVVVCSAQVGGDDLGRERRAICDATLRLPVSNSRLANVLLAASRIHAVC